MVIMRLVNQLVLLSCVTSSISAGQRIASKPGERALGARLDSAIRSDITSGFAGAVLVAKGDRIILDRGYGKTGGAQIQANARFWIASAGKQFTSAAIVKCAERGRLSLDDSIAHFFPDAPAEKRSITVRQLLGHLSGFGQSYAGESERNQQGAVAKLLAVPLVDQPGAHFHYSNANYQLAVAIVERVSGTNYRRFVQDEFLTARGLGNTGFSGSPPARRVLAGRNPAPARVDSAFWGGEGVFSSTTDLFRWYRALRAGRVFARGFGDSLFAPVAPIEEGRTALGWFLGTAPTGEPTVFTRGNEDWGPNSLLYAYPDRDIVIVVLTHSGDSPAGPSWSRFVHAQVEKVVLAARVSELKQE